jgi:hypothetical protein
MKRIIFVIISLIAVFNLAAQTSDIKQWLSFRGPFAKGFIEDAKNTNKLESGNRRKYQVANFISRARLFLSGNSGNKKFMRWLG